jgi:hypothetical protein
MYSKVHVVWSSIPVQVLFVTPPLSEHITLEADEGEEWSSSWHLLGKTESQLNEKDPEAMQI